MVAKVIGFKGSSEWKHKGIFTWQIVEHHVLGQTTLNSKAGIKTMT